MNEIPIDFNYIQYLQYNPDLVQAGIATEQDARIHYLLFGKKENRIYKNATLIKDIDKDFDMRFYIEEYPETKSYYETIPNISLKEKLFHHYIHYGIQEGRFKNKLEKTRALIDYDSSILNKIDIKDLQHIKNKLECICLLITEKEIQNGQYDKFINILSKQTKPLKKYKNISFKIIVNNLTKATNKSIFNKSRLLKNIFSQIDVVDLNLSPQEDLYVLDKTHLTNLQLPKYGLKSGPNITFFRTIDMCKDYNTTLFLETDCLLSNNWLNTIINYTKNTNGFLVSGAIYDGFVFVASNSVMRTHINGGTGLYATGNKVLQTLIKILETFMQKQIANNLPGLAYDYALKLLIDNNLDNTYNKPLERTVWQFISRNYLPCKAIINCSIPSDSVLNEQDLYRQYHYAILHKKSNE